MTVYQLMDLKGYVHNELEKKVDLQQYDRINSKYSAERSKLQDLLSKALNKYLYMGASIYHNNKRSRHGIVCDIADKVCLKISLDKKLQNFESVEAEIEKGAKELHQLLQNNLKETKKELAQIKQTVRVIIKKLK